MEGNVMGTKQRLPWIDVSKGILILFVVLGHIEYYAQEFVERGRPCASPLDH